MHENGEVDIDRFAITNQQWNSYQNDAKYVGYMFGGAQGEASTSYEQATRNETNSDIKTAIDNWYERNLHEEYGKYIGDGIFCNDRSTPGKAITGWSLDTGLGYGKNTTAYGMTSRLSNINNNWGERVPIMPTLKCPQKNDSFTVSDTIKGNGALTYPVGLITGDEITIAGYKIPDINKAYYLYKGFINFTMTPSNANKNYSSIYQIGWVPGLSGSIIELEKASPVINIKSKYIDQLIGEGTMESPFQIIN